MIYRGDGLHHLLSTQPNFAPPIPSTRDQHFDFGLGHSTQFMTDSAHVGLSCMHEDGERSTPSQTRAG